MSHVHGLFSMSETLWRTFVMRIPQRLRTAVPTSDSTAKIAEVSQHRQRRRSALSVSSVAGQPSSIGGDRNQNSDLCADISSFCRAAHRNHPERMPRSHVVLDDSRPRAEATRFPGLLLRLSSARRTQGASSLSANWNGIGITTEFRFVPLAQTLSRVVSDTNRRVIL